MNESAREAHVQALGEALHAYLALEWLVAWLIDLLSPGSADDVRRATARRLAEQFEEAVAIYQAEAGDHPRLAALANRLGQLVAERDRLVHGHPYVDSTAETKLLFTARMGRQLWTVDQLQAVTRAFEEAGAEALALLTLLQAEQETGAVVPAAVPATPAPAEDVSESLGYSALADAAAIVRAQLDSQPRALKMPAGALEIYVVRDFLSAGECADLIAMIEGDLVPSGILSQDPDPTFRTSSSCNLQRDHPLVRDVDSRIAALLGVDRAYSETIQGQRYAVGQQFKPHHDFFHKSEYYWEDIQREGGQRTWTAMAFLNVPEAGGQTNFPEAGLKIAPRTGNLLVWNNLDLYGAPNQASLHEGVPVEAGLKYVITKWFRERPWGLRVD